ncbi:MAG: hypothetical protein JWQ23_1764 [Herminiimonas sp.]|jgi:hypothetical protein|nr:hypothetical protein [Herminiimonas sp.]
MLYCDEKKHFIKNTGYERFPATLSLTGCGNLITAASLHVVMRRHIKGGKAHAIVRHFLA